MQLLLRRNQRTGGLSGSAIFCLDARVEFAALEKESIRRYRLGSQTIYNSEASKRALAKGDAADDGSVVGNLKRLAYAGLASLRLNITVDSLARGQHIECKSLDELLGAEEAILDACRNLRAYLNTAATFDGREVVVDFASDEPQVVAQAMPKPALVAAVAAPPPQTAPPPTPVPAPEPVRYELVDGEAVPVASARIRGVASDSFAATRDGDQMLKVILGVVGAFVVVILVAVVLSMRPAG